MYCKICCFYFDCLCTDEPDEIMKPFAVQFWRYEFGAPLVMLSEIGPIARKRRPDRHSESRLQSCSSKQNSQLSSTFEFQRCS